MIKVLVIEINCGETTCASEPGKFCEYFGSRRFGITPVCMLFPMKKPGRKDIGSSTELKQIDGWVQRCQECLLNTEV